MQYNIELRRHTSEKTLKKIRRGFSESALSNIVTESELEAVTKAPQLTDLIVLGILNQKFPFNISRNDELFKELRFYDISESEKIAEIGAGKGEFSLLMFMTGRRNTIFINEIQPYVLEYVALQLSKGTLQHNGSTINIVKGSAKETNIPEQVDKMILRSSLHHFRKMDEMLQSIRRGLKEEGILYIHEYPKKADGTRKCRKSMSEEEIRSAVGNNGFKIVGEMRSGDSLVFKCKKG